MKEQVFKKEIPQNLLQWFEKNKRDLPWRKTKDPYRIWVSEIMLQQTRVDTVIEYYNRFLGRFPTIRDLAEAEEQEVLKYWQGLGYYSRARNLHKGAKMIMEQYGGVFPNKLEKVKKIPGIGAYTSGAILSIAFNLPYPAVDGNVLRVFARIFNIKEDIIQASTVKLIQQKVSQYMPDNRASEFTEALMELGALICVPTAPLCLTCPLFHQCEARQQGIQEELPIKTKKTKPRKMHMVFCVVRHNDKILIQKNPYGNILKEMWGFPVKEGMGKEDEKTVKQILDEIGTSSQTIEKVGTARHIFSHMDWDMHIYQCQTSDAGLSDEQYQWVTKKDITSYPFPKVYRRVLEKIEW